MMQLVIHDLTTEGWDRMAKSNSITPQDLYRTEIKLHGSEKKDKC